jgi:hypothetical protein
MLIDKTRNTKPAQRLQGPISMLDYKEMWVPKAELRNVADALKKTT